jgi:hypothetical protein
MRLGPSSGNGVHSPAPDSRTRGRRPATGPLLVLAVTVGMLVALWAPARGVRITLTVLNALLLLVLVIALGWGRRWGAAGNVWSFAASIGWSRL